MATVSQVLWGEMKYRDWGLGLLNDPGRTFGDGKGS